MITVLGELYAPVSFRHLKVVEEVNSIVNTLFLPGALPMGSWKVDLNPRGEKYGIGVGLTERMLVGMCATEMV